MRSMMLMAFLGILAAASTSAAQLGEIKERALLNSPNLKLLDLEIEKYKRSESLGAAGYLPRFGIDMATEQESGDGFSETETTGSIYGELNLLNGFQDQLLKESSKIKSSIAKQGLEVAKKKVSLTAELLFYEMLFHRSYNAILDRAIIRNKAHQVLIRKRMSSGLTSSSDLLEFRLEESTLTSQKHLVDAKEKRAAKVLSFLTELDQASLRGNRKATIPRYLFDLKLSEKILSEFTQYAPTLMQLEGHIELGAETAKVESYNWLPTLDLKARYGRIPEDETLRDPSLETFRVGLYASWELYSGGEKSAKRALANISHQRKKLEFVEHSRALKLRLIKALEELEQTDERINDDEKSLALAQQLYEKTISEYKRGVKDSGALSSVSHTILATQESILKNKWDFMNHKNEVEEIIGKPLELREVRSAR